MPRMYEDHASRPKNEMVLVEITCIVLMLLPVLNLALREQDVKVEEIISNHSERFLHRVLLHVRNFTEFLEFREATQTRP